MNEFGITKMWKTNIFVTHSITFQSLKYKTVVYMFKTEERKAKLTYVRLTSNLN